MATHSKKISVPSRKEVGLNSANTPNDMGGLGGSGTILDICLGKDGLYFFIAILDDSLKMAVFGFWMIPKNPQKRNRFKRSRR